MRRKIIFKIVLSGAFIAIGWILPFVTGQIPEIGSMLLPMHLPIFIAAIILGQWYGLAIGMIVPITRSLIFTMPPLYPGALGMMFELGAYGFITGFLFNVVFKNFRKSKGGLIAATYASIVPAMIIGRGIWGLARLFLALIPGKSFTFAMFIAGAFVDAWPGIVIQLVLIPLIVFAFQSVLLIEDIEKEEEPDKVEPILE